MEEFGDQGVPFLTAKLLNDGRVDIHGAPRLADEKANKLRIGFVETGDVLLSHNATIGRVAIVPNYTGRLLIGTSLTYFRLDESRLLPSYLASFFKGFDFQNQLKAVMSHSTRNQIPITAQRLLRIMVPPLPVQKAIASILSALDDRIDLLRQTNTTLEVIAQALFKSWFVDFDPVHAKAEGREPEAMDAATAALFPSEFEDSELGLIPKGWKSLTFGDAAYLSKGSVNPLATPNTEFDHYSLPAFDAGQLPVCEAGGAIKSNKTPVPPGAVLVSKLNPHIPRVWPVGATGVNAVCSTEFLVWVPKAPASSVFVYCLASSQPFNSAMRQLVTGTSNSHQRVKPDQLNGLRVCAASDAALEAFASIASPLLQRILDNRQQSATLAQLRDTLLPRLISGKLRLPDAEREIETVV